MSRIDSWLSTPQPRLHGAGLLALLLTGSIVVPLSLDMYTPAVPHMAEYFSTTPVIVNLTLLGYYLFLSLGLLVFGPVSDKIGRKPMLVAGMAGYCLSSVLCALSVSIWMLVVCRVGQALASGAISAVCTAVVKDAVKADQREKMLSVIQVMFVVGPVGAPIIGAAILQVASWRGTFWVLAAISAAMLTLSLLFSETLPASERLSQGLPKTLGRLVVVAKSKPFVIFLLVTSSFEVAFMAYVSVGSYIYMDFFGLSALGYSLLFAIASLACAAGPLIWLALSSRVSAKRFLTAVLVLCLALGVGVATAGHQSPLVFCLLTLVFAGADAAVRPTSVNILLSQRDGDTGSVSSLINFVRTFAGVVGMALAMLPWSDYLVGLGALIALGAAAALAGWVWLLRSRMVLRGIKNGEEAIGLL
ncbi:MAG: MFS transporter [Coriobacteriales bacterium]|nr:MFS transporter [Coriobacteriales bacterium]